MPSCLFFPSPLSSQPSLRPGSDGCPREATPPPSLSTPSVPCPVSSAVLPGVPPRFCCRCHTHSHPSPSTPRCCLVVWFHPPLRESMATGRLFFSFFQQKTSSLLMGTFHLWRWNGALFELFQSAWAGEQPVNVEHSELYYTLYRSIPNQLFKFRSKFMFCPKFKKNHTFSLPLQV